MDSNNFVKELNIIKQIVYSNGYNVEMINLMLKKELIKKTIENICPVKVPENDNNKFTCITYLGNVTNYKTYK